MASLNSVHLIGNLTAKPELRYTPKGTAVADFSLAINRRWKDDAGKEQEAVTFVDVTAWGRLGEIADKYLGKGKPVFIGGRLHLEEWDDKTTGKRRTRLKVIAEELQLIAVKAPSDSAEPGPF